MDDGLAGVARWSDAAAPVADLPADLAVRRAPLHAFPYPVVYLIEHDTLHLLAIAHDHRRPSYWRDRSS